MNTVVSVGGFGDALMQQNGLKMTPWNGTTLLQINHQTKKQPKKQIKVTEIFWKCVLLLYRWLPDWFQVNSVLLSLYVLGSGAPAIHRSCWLQLYKGFDISTGAETEARQENKQDGRRVMLK